MTGITGKNTEHTRCAVICPFSINIGPIHINQIVSVSGSGCVKILIKCCLMHTFRSQVKACEQTESFYL